MPSCEAASCARHGTAADPANREAYRLGWNWCRMPGALSAAVREPASVAVIPGVLSHLGALLDRDVAGEPAGMHARDALIAALG